MFWNSLKKKMLIKLMEYYYMKPELQINAQQSENIELNMILSALT
jgi:hypothetical protein